MNLGHGSHRAGIWRSGVPISPQPNSIPSGFTALDPLLPGGGWPLGALTEIITTHEGVGALRLLTPALAQLSGADRWLAWIAPPYIPYAPALAAAGIDLSRVMLVHAQKQHDILWAAEQALRSGTSGAVLVWLSENIDPKRLHRLQLAAEAGGSLGLIFRPYGAADQASPAALRLLIEPASEYTDVHILKRRGGWPTGPLALDLDHVSSAPEGLHPGLLRQ
ncbi:MAG: translesion DNA synthesis-associated protein ImuA [Gammaproteobacteria bacterium]|nr:translesion DNA synthesis-associated protein ImuA [Gammaproteobacteria bacterium]